MADRITIDYNSAHVIDALRRLVAGLGPDGLRAPLKEIGEDLVESTRRRFATSTAPDGARWAPNAQSTYLGLLRRTDSRKDGRVKKPAATRLASKRPLVDTGTLAGSIRYQVVDGGATLEVGTNWGQDDIPGIGAAVHQLGRRDGSIPARPFLGLSAQDEQSAMQVLQTYLGRLLDR